MDGCMIFYDNEYGKNEGALVERKFCKKKNQGIMATTLDQVTKNKFQLRQCSICL